jgi:hypothetical protein
MSNNTANTAATANVANAAATAAASNSNVQSFFDTLIQKHDTWNNGSRKVSKQELYAILASCMAFAEQIVAKHQYAELDAELTRRNFVTTAKASVITRILRCVFNTQHRSLSAYAAVVKIAKSEEQTSDTFVAWLNQHGGIDTVRRNFAKTRKQVASAADLQITAKNHLATAPALAVISKANLANVATPHSSGFIINISRLNANGDIEVVASTVDSTAVRAALTNWGLFVTKSNIESGEEASVRERTAALAQAIAA